MSQEVIRKILKHPDDAVFEHPKGGKAMGVLDFSSEVYSDTLYGIRGRVKAQNDFGATLTYRWECIWEVPDFDASRARLTKVIYDGQVISLDK